MEIPDAYRTRGSNYKQCPEDKKFNVKLISWTRGLRVKKRPISRNYTMKLSDESKPSYK